MAPDLRSPWLEFLSELDGLLSEPVDLHCVGGFVARAIPLDAALLRERYVTELRPGIIGDLKSHDLTLELWLEEYFPAST
jgi:hypothetical protein